MLRLSFGSYDLDGKCESLIAPLSTFNPCLSFNPRTPEPQGLTGTATRSLTSLSPSWVLSNYVYYMSACSRYSVCRYCSCHFSNYHSLPFTINSSPLPTCLSITSSHTSLPLVPLVKAILGYRKPHNIWSMSKRSP